MVQLRWPKPEDAKSLLEYAREYARDPQIPRTRWSPISFGTTTASVQLAVEEMCRGWNGPAGLTVIAAEPGSDKLVGIFTLRRLADANAAEIAYGVVPRYHRRGVATQGLRLLAPWALVEFNLQRVEVRIPRSHTVSRRVAEQAGFQCEENGQVYHSPSGGGLRYILRV